uniref:guanine nucleotide-binding protein subunit beta-like protein 1 n=1 Tax=Myxine glutinosa TaxID=7769 RepID=UPI003590190C
MMARQPPPPLFVLREGDSGISAVHFPQQEGEAKIIYSGCESGQVRVWDLGSRRVQQELKAHGDKTILWLHFDDGSLFSQGRDGWVRRWSMEEGRADICASFIVEGLGFCKAALSKGMSDEVEETGRQLLAVPGKEMDEVCLYDVASGHQVGTLKSAAEPSLGMVTCMQFLQISSGAGLLLLAGYESGSLCLWDIRMGQLLSRSPARQDPIFCLAWDGLTGTCVSAGPGESLETWKLNDGRDLEHDSSIPLPQHGVSALKIRGDGRLLAAGCWDGRIRIWSRHYRPLASLAFHRRGLCDLDFADPSPRAAHCAGRRLLAAASRDGQLSVWDLYNDKRR